MRQLFVLVFYTFLVGLYTTSEAQTIIPPGSTWLYLDDGSNQGTLWQTNNFDDSNWSSGAAQLGYGDGDEITLVDYGGGITNRPITTYFRHTFMVDETLDLSAFVGLQLKLLRDDGAVVYLNGQEIVRSNMSLLSTIDYMTTASSTTSAQEETYFYRYFLPTTALQNGSNTLAVEVHLRASNSDDMSFDLGLDLLDKPAVVRGPYLQMLTNSGVIIKWRTQVATEGKVWYGTAIDNLNGSASGIGSNIDHQINLGGLLPNTKYFYAIGNDTLLLSPPDSSHYFITAPPIGSTNACKMWVIGDAGTADNNQIMVRDAYYNHIGPHTHTDLWLMLGDNAYNFGSDEEYQFAIFENMYEDILVNTPVWPCPGNHDYYSINSLTLMGPYYDIFTLPTTGEAGGLASGTEAYYSFDYANVHFVSLDSHDSDRSVNGAMLTWLQADLAATTQEWLIAYFHHPPYSKGSHDSDSELRLIEMRENALPILEAAGVDLVLSGHSHSYERSYLINGHYGHSSTFNSSMLVNGDSGKENFCEAYDKTTSGPNAGIGTIYTVAGSAGKNSGELAQHPVMYSFLNQLGSVMIDVEDKRLDLTFIRSDNETPDHFTLYHDFHSYTDTLVEVGSLLSLNASWEGTYVWTHSGETTQSISVSPTEPQVYAVYDPISCHTDSFYVSFNEKICYTPNNTDQFPNPERGLYEQFTAYTADSPNLAISTLQNLYNNDNISLILRLYYLGDYINAPISSNYLALINEDLAILRQSACKAIIRFAYNDATQILGHTDDASLAIVLQHIEQLSPVLRTNSDVIATLQAGFVGTWGEWYYTHPDFLNDDDSPHIANRQAVIAALLAALPNDRTIALRTPLYKQTLYGNGAPFDENDALNNSTAYTGSDLARLAHHNDCFLASDTDFGTYSIDPSTRAMEQSYLAADTRFLPMGGETCALNIPRSDCASEGGAADNELAQFHWSYLNKNYNTDVLSRWDSLSGGPGNCYGAIKRQLGYRFQLIDAHIDASVRQGCDFNFNLRLINQGYAAPYNPRRVDLILENTLTNARYTIAMPNQNPQFWLAQSDYHALYNTDTITINETLGISKDVPAGNYNLYLHLPDPTTHLYEQPAYAIRLANDATWQAATGFNDLQYTIKVIASDCEVPYDGTQYSVPYGCYIGNSLALSTDTLDCNESLEIIQASFSLVNQHIQWVLSDTPISDLSDTNNAILLGTGASLAIANYCDTLALGTYYFTPFIQSDNCGSLGTSTAITFINKRIFKAKVWLQAPYIPSFGAMTNTLQNNNLFPLQQPYNVSPWYYGGTEYVATTNDLPPYTSDWLLIEALDTNNIIQQQRAVFLRNDGQLIDTDGKEGIYFDQLLSNQPYYFIIRHRNHLAIKSNVPLYLNSSTTYDFSNPSNIDNGNTQLASIGFGVYAMYSGDADGNGIISLSDFNTYLSTAGASNTYTIADFNLDGNVTVVDYNDYKPNASIIGITAVRY